MHGLDKPKLTQYAVYLNNLLKDEFWVSIRTNHKVLDMPRDMTWNTLFIMGSKFPKT
jgi:ABC-type dipeptide/oligopeptide/nickel transport system permease component